MHFLQTVIIIRLSIKLVGDNNHRIYESVNGPLLNSIEKFDTAKMSEKYNTTTSYQRFTNLNDKFVSRKMNFSPEVLQN
jgi:hypothetical protein